MVPASKVQITLLRGRDAECRLIGDLLDRATQPVPEVGAGVAGHRVGAGGALLLHGEPGSGRTSLVEHAHRCAERADRPYAVLAATGVADEAGLPYAGLQRLLDPVRDRADRLDPAPRRLLRAVLAGDGCAGEHRLALAMAVLGMLSDLARDRPLLCTMDDVDLGDRQSAEVLSFVARRLGQPPVVLLLTAGTDAAVTGAPSHRLTPLDPADGRAVLLDRLPDRPPDHVADTLVAVAGGNPRALADLAGSLTPGQCRGEEPPPGEPPAGGTLARAYRARLAGLPAAARRLLLLAAVDGRLEPATLIRAAATLGLPSEALGAAEAAGLVRIEPEAVAFPWPLARIMIVTIASPAERLAAHLLLADLLDGPAQGLRRMMHLAAAATQPDAGLADELERAATGWAVDPATATTVLHRAALLTDEPARAARRRVAAARCAWTAGRPEQAGRLLRQLPGAVAAPTVAQVDLLRGEMELRCGSLDVALSALLEAAQRLAPVDRAGALGALARAGEAIAFSGDQYRYAEVARQALALARPDDPPTVALVSAQVAGVAATLRGDHRRAGPALRRAIVLGERLTGTPAAALLTCAATAALLAALDGAAHRLAERAVDVARRTGNRSILPRALELRASAEYWLGRHEAAADSAREGLRVARSAGQTNWAAVHLGLLAVLAAIRGDHDASLDHIRQLSDGLPPYSRPRALADWALAVLDLTGGRPDEAVRRLAALARPGTGRGQVLVQVMATPYLVEAAAHTEQRPVAQAALAVFDRWASGTANPSRRALSARCHALLAERGSAQARENYATALRLHPCDTGAFERARTELLFGRELRRGRRPRQARDHLHAAREAFLSVGAGALAQQAAQELRAAGETVGTPQPSAVPLLTGQQLRIAQLVAEGATNREIAARMFLSTRTVDHHLRNIFTRLNIRSRTELVRVLS